MPANEIRARLGAARIVLDRAAGTPGHVAASRTQCSAMIATVSRCTVSVEELAELQVLASQIQWADGDLVQVLQSLSSPASQHPARRSMQDFSALHDYFTATEWVVLEDHELGMCIKRDVILQRATNLGARCPTEGSIKYMSSLLLVCSEPPGPLTRMTSEQKQNTCKFIKSEFKKLIRKLSQPASYVEQLPSDPKHLQIGQPALFAKAYGCEGPVPCKPDVLQRVLVQIKLRPGGVRYCLGGAAKP